MSSIIDALKKSDKNRNQAGKGSVNQIKFESQTNTPKRRGFYLLIVALLVVTGGVLAWQQGWLSAAKNKWFTTAEEVQTVDAQPNNKNQQQTPQNDQPKPKVANKLTPPKPDVIRQKSNQINQSQLKNQQPAGANKQADTPSTQPHEQVEITAITSSEETIEPIIAEDKPVPTQRKAQAKKTERQAADNTQPNPKELQTREQPPKQQHLLLHQLDFETRKSIPPVKLNIHIYDPEPENRMVIINGVKFITGDIIEEAITVQEINQQGVVLEFGGTTFLIPK